MIIIYYDKGVFSINQSKCPNFTTDLRTRKNDCDDRSGYIKSVE